MRLPIYQIDAFAEGPFTGNPAAVCPLEGWLPDHVMQAIAAEINLSETAFFVPEADGYRLRWYTPTTEVDLCGHATLASAFVVFRWLSPQRNEVTFQTQQAGPLTVARDGDRLALDFPARPPSPCPTPDGLAAALGSPPATVLAARDYLAVYESADEIRALTPDFAAIAKLDRFAVIATAPGANKIDFVSRFFAPARRAVLRAPGRPRHDRRSRRPLPGRQDRHLRIAHCAKSRDNPPRPGRVRWRALRFFLPAFCCRLRRLGRRPRARSRS